MCRKCQYLLIGLLLYMQQLSAQIIHPLLQPFVAVNKPVSSSAVQQKADSVYGTQFYAVQGEVPAGTTIFRRLSRDIFIVGIRSVQEKENLLQRLPIVIPVNNQWKLSPELLQGLPKSTQPVAWLLSVTDVSAFQQTYSSNKNILLHQSDDATGTWRVTATTEWIKNNLLPDPNIYFIAVARKPFTERELTGFDLSTNRINTAHRNWPSTNGKGLTISIKENKMDTADIDFRGRYLFSPAASASMQTHATTMATIAAGAGNTYYTGKGVAWGANISSSDFANLLPDKTSELQQLTVGIQNHSYGVGIENYYGADAAAYDAQLAANPTLMHVFSAGNAGTQTSNSGNYTGIAGFANLSGSFKMSKNSIAVGATDSFGMVALPSSRGPAFDGRLKPELVALGEDGSSGAAAIVSGIAALVQDAWQQKNNTRPASSLTKAILLNSAEDVGTAGIDFASGYGAVNAFRALQTIQDTKVFQGNIAASQIQTHTIEIPANARKLKLTLCWTDPAAQANTFKALVNDLDMELIHTGSTQKWLPWVLNSSPVKDSLQLLPVRKRDSLNNTEQISIEIPPAGTYQLLIKGTSLSVVPQAYSIAWQYDTLDHFMFTYPVKGDNLFPKQTHTIRWQTTLPGSGVLQYRINTGNWKPITTSIDLSKNYVQWQAPDSIGALQLRLLHGAKEWVTDTVTVSASLPINTGLNCIDSFLVYWQRAQVNSYRVYTLGAQYLKPLTVTTDTLLLQSKQNNPDQYFTVAPILPFSIEGARSYTFNYTQQQVDCYISGFIADPVGTSQARLSLQLGTLYRVSNIVFEKLTANGFIPIQTISPVGSKQIIITTEANKGLTIFRARIELVNGQIYYTNQEQVIQFAGQSYYVFPNPVKQGAALRLLAEDTDDTVFMLYDLQGRMITTYKINGLLNQITLPLLQKGIYYYTITKSSVRMLSQKLIVL